MDRQHEPFAEPVVRLLVIDRDAQARLLQGAFVKRAERAFQRLPVRRGIAEPEPLHRMRVEPARGEIGARRRPVSRGEIAREPALRCFGHVDQPGALLGHLRRARIGGGDLHPGLCGQFLDRIHEGKAALVGHPTDHIAMCPAAEAVVKPLLVIDGEAGGLFRVERAARFPFAARALQFLRPHDDRGQGHAGA